MHLENRIRNRWYGMLSAWFDRRAPLAQYHVLHLKNLYILPTRTGMLFLLLAVLIWLLGTNYQNNLILALAYLQISLMIMVILKTFSNLAGLEIRSAGSNANFVGQPAGFNLQLRTANPAGADNIRVCFRDGAESLIQLEAGQAAKCILTVAGLRRGRLRAARISIRSTFPLGMAYCWTWLNFDAEVLVWPEPIDCPFPLSSIDAEPGAPDTRRAASDDIVGLRRYQAGDSMRQIVWKHYARDKGLYKKDLAQYSGIDNWLKWEDFYQGDAELCLSHLCYWVQELTHLQTIFGLQLPGYLLEPGQGEQHRLEALNALARHDVPL